MSDRIVYQYTNNEWAVIDKCLNTLSPPKAMLREIYTLIKLSSCGSISPTRKTLDDALTRHREAMEAASVLERYYSEEVNFAGGLYLQDDHLNEFPKYLLDIMDYAKKEVARTQERIKSIDSPVVRTANLDRGQMYSFVARAWEKAGGKINGSAQYRAFFEAVVRPILDDKYSEERLGMSWSDNLFRSHANEVMRQKGITGSRGRQRNS